MNERTCASHALEKFSFDWERRSTHERMEAHVRGSFPRGSAPWLVGTAYMRLNHVDVDIKVTNNVDV